MLHLLAVFLTFIFFFLKLISNIVAAALQVVFAVMCQQIFIFFASFLYL